MQRKSSVSTSQCAVRGSLEPSCNAVGLIDWFFFGESHLFQRPVYRRTEECSINSPDCGPLPPNAPAWCLAPFDPEGLLRTWASFCLTEDHCIMKGVAACLLALLGGNTCPSADDLRNILSSGSVCSSKFKGHRNCCRIFVGRLLLYIW